MRHRLAWPELTLEDAKVALRAPRKLRPLTLRHSRQRVLMWSRVRARSAAKALVEVAEGTQKGLHVVDAMRVVFAGDQAPQRVLPEGGAGLGVFAEFGHPVLLVQHLRETQHSEAVKKLSHQVPTH